MRRDILWAPADGRGMEHLRLASDDDGVVADGLLIGHADDTPFRARYTVHCLPDWRVREVVVDALDSGASALHLLTDGVGHWRDGATGEPLPQLDGCLFVDISATPFTNTLPIRQLGLERGEQAEIVVVYIALPAMSAAVARQRYTCVEPLSAEGGVYRYESLTTGFTVELPVDGDGVPRDYPGIWRRVWPTS